MAPRASARFTSRKASSSRRCFAAASRSADGAPARKILPALSASARRPKSAAGISRKILPASKICATGWKTGSSKKSRTCRINGGGAERLPNTCNVAFDYADGEAVLHHLDRAGIAASSGSACASGSMEPSHVLRAMNVPPVALQGAIRFSLSRETADGDIDRVLEILPGLVADGAREIAALGGNHSKTDRVRRP